MLKIIFLEIFWFESGKVGKTLTKGSIKPFFVDKSIFKTGQKPTFFGQKVTMTKITLEKPGTKVGKPTLQNPKSGQDFINVVNYFDSFSGKIGLGQVSKICRKAFIRNSFSRSVSHEYITNAL